MTTLTLLKLVLTPLLLGMVSLAERRWGSGVAGWLAGLPLTSGPISIFLSIEYGNGFAAEAAVGTLLGLVALGAFCLVFAGTAHACRRWTGPGWTASVALGLSAFLAVTYALRDVHGGLVITVLAVIAWLAGVCASLRQLSVDSFTQPSHSRHLGWEVPTRMTVAAVFVLVLTAAARSMGPQMSGLLSPLPIFGGVLAAFTHHTKGVSAVLMLLRGIVLGSFAFAGFFVTVALLLSHVGATLAYPAAVGCALSINAAVLPAARRLRQGPFDGRPV